MSVRRADLEHMHEERCCWNCGADNARIPSEEPPFDPQGMRGMFEAMVICHEDRCPTTDMFGDYASPIFKESEWHPIAAECPAWVSADGIFPASRIVPVPAAPPRRERGREILSNRDGHG